MLNLILIMTIITKKINKEQKINMHTESICPVCKKIISAYLIQHKNNIYLKKNCPSHGNYYALLSINAKRYLNLRNFYNMISQKAQPLAYTIITAADPCEKYLMQDIYYQDNKKKHIKAYELKKLLSTQPKTFIIICDSDKTSKDDLKNIIKVSKDHQKTAFLYTEGEKLKDLRYLQQLIHTGLKRIYTFADSPERKKDILQNLKQSNISTVLNVPLEEKQYKKTLYDVFSYTLTHEFISEVNFYCNHTEKILEKKFNLSALDYGVYILEKKYPDIISLEKIYLFQKLHYLYMRIIKRSTCFNFLHFWIIRCKEKFIPITDLLNLKNKETLLDKIAVSLNNNNKIISKILIIKLLLQLTLSVMKKYKIILPKITNMFFYNVLNVRDKYTDASKDFIHIIFSSCCNPVNFDQASAKHCMTGIIWKHPENNITQTDRRYKYLKKYWN